MGQEWTLFEMMERKREREELAVLIECSQMTEEKFGLTLTEKEAEELIAGRNESLRRYQRVEFGRGILDRLIFYFCDSQYIWQENYVQNLKRLQDIFYRFKNESGDHLTDEELLNFMREQFEEVCFGDLDDLEGTCLERFAKAVRAGYRGYQEKDGKNEYEKFSEETRWDSELYMQALRELTWE